MKRIMTVVLLSSTLNASAFAQMKSVYKPYDMDIEEAHLNKQWKRVEEVAAAEAKFLAIREDLILNGYKKAIDTWFADAQKWTNSWANITKIMLGTSLTDPDEQDKFIRLSKAQGVALDELISRVTTITRMGETASSGLKSLPTFPADYIDIMEDSSSDSYAPQIDYYHKQVKEAQGILDQTKTIFDDSLTTKLKGMGEGLTRSLPLKIEALSINFPAVKVALKRCLDALNELRVIDTVLARLDRKSEVIAKKIADQQIFGAQQDLAEWKIQADLELKTIETSAQATPALKAFAKNMINSKYSIRQGQIDDQLESASEVELFSYFYEKEMDGPTGMVTRCKATVRPKNIDCNRVRMIQGFKMNQLLQLSPEQAAYIEGLILKAKSGIFKT